MQECEKAACQESWRGLWHPFFSVHPFTKGPSAVHDPVISRWAARRNLASCHAWQTFLMPRCPSQGHSHLRSSFVEWPEMTLGKVKCLEACDGDTLYRLCSNGFSVRILVFSCILSMSFDSKCHQWCVTTSDNQRAGTLYKWVKLSRHIQTACLAFVASVTFVTFWH